VEGNMSEKEQIESLKKWWDENASSLVIGVFLGLSVLLGGKAWISWKDTQAQNSSNIYAQMQSALKQNDVEMARSQANDLIANYTDSG
jgi:predicted negative regulator of RcsB-dependent stress response